MFEPFQKVIHLNLMHYVKARVFELYQRLQFKSILLFYKTSIRIDKSNIYSYKKIFLQPFFIINLLKQMKITYLNQTHTLNMEEKINFQGLESCIKTHLKNLPINFMIVFCGSTQMSRTVIRCQKDLQKMMYSTKGEICLKIQERNEEQYLIIKSDERNSDFEDIVSQNDEDSPQVLKTMNIDEIICNKLQKLLPSMIGQMKNQLKSGSCSNKMTNKDTNFDNRLMNTTCQLMKKWMKECEQMMEKMKMPMNQMEDICELQKYFTSEYMNQMCQMEKQKQRIMEIFCIMDECCPRNDVKCYMKEMNCMHEEVMCMKDNQWNCLMSEKDKFERQLCTQQKQFRCMLNSWIKNIEEVKCEYNMNNHTKMMNTCMQMWNCLKTYEQQAQKLNKRQRMCCLQVTDYSDICCWMKEMQMYKCFWVCINCWNCCHHEWMNCCIEQINMKNVEQKVEKCFAQICWVMRNMKNQKMIQNCEEIMNQIKMFRKEMPLMSIFATEGMCDRHWDQINKKCNVNINGKCTFKNIMILGLMNHQQWCCQVSKMAEKENQIWQMLKDIQYRWKNQKFCLQQEKNEMCYIKNAKDMMEWIDKDMLCLKNMQYSVCAKNCEQKMSEWKNNTMKICDMIQKYEKFEKCWRYISPVCESSICQQIPKLEQEYKCMIKMWRQVMNIVELSKSVYTCCCCSESFCEKIQACCQKMDCIQKCLNQFLSEKKKYFPRLHFISNDELLKMDTTMNTNQNWGCFEGINNVQYDEQQNITHIVSQEGEKIKLWKCVGTKAKKVQVIMKDFEEMMKQTIRRQLQRSVNCFVKTEKRDWIRNHPSQCALVASQIWWACQTEKAIKDNCLVEHCQKQIKNLTELIILAQQNLTKIERTIVNCLITVKVHEKDLIQNYKGENVRNINDFNWQKVVRHYWSEDKCQVRCYLSETQYCNEYIGCKQNLVITPLTDKCYMTMMTCLKQGLGYSAVGPAGTGKTQTIKDLGRSIGQMIIVINSSDQINYKTNQEILKGAAGSGIWCCYDEFNRMDISVISAFAQQFKKVSECRNNKLCCFEGEQFEVKPSFFIGITFNPGYAGRSQLPVSTQQCFRTMTLFVPDLIIICKNMLFSHGFISGSILAEKIFACFTLFKEELSKQDHYDFGLRNIKSVIDLCSCMKKQYPEMQQQEILFKCIRKNFDARMVKEDNCAFETIMKENFLSVYNCKVSQCMMKEEIKLCCERNNLQFNDQFTEKVHQVQVTSDLRHSMMLLGQTRSGKSVTCQIAAQSKGNTEGITIHRHFINPKSMTMDQLYGYYDSKNCEWRDGVLSSVMRECSKDNSQNHHWIVLDGPVDACWIQSMNTVMDDNKKLCLASGQIIPLTPRMKIVFEIEDVCVVSPATVSRNGFVQFNCEQLGTEPLVFSWMKELPQQIMNKQKMMITLKYLFNDYICECLNFMQTCKMVAPLPKTKMMEDLLKLLKCYLMCYVKENMLENMQKNIVEIFHWCIVCCLGNLIMFEERKKFDKFIKELCMKKMRKIFPDQGCVYDYQYNMMNNCWVPWMKCPQMWEVMNTDMNKCMVPTKDFMRNNIISKMLLKNGYPVLLVGPMCSGKSLQCEQIMKIQNWCEIQMSFTSNTTSQHVTDSIMCSLEKRRKRQYGPPLGKKCLICIDDINLPKKEVYGAMPPLQVIRYMMEYKNLWDLENLTKCNIEDCTVMGVYCDNNYQKYTNRFLSKFNMLYCPQPCDQTMSHIFETMLCNKMKRYPENIRCMKEEMSNACVQVFNFMKKNFSKCLDEPYCCNFTAKDACRVMQGICEMNPENIVTCQDMMNLCVYENMRIYYNKLSSFENRKMMKQGVQRIMKNIMNQCSYSCEEVIFTECMDENSKYCTINNMDMLMEKMNNCLERYNNEICHESMNMGMSKQICRNVANLCQILRKERSNALLLGRDICGRKSMTKMACYMMNCEWQEAMMCNDNMGWQKWMKKLLMKVICENRNQCVMIQECNMDKEMMTRVCDMMKMKCMNFWTMQEMNKIEIACQNECLERKMQMNPKNIMKIWKQRLNKNLHWLICINPQQRNIRVTMKDFPALMNECTVCWMDNWTQQSYLAIGKNVLQQKPKCQTNWSMIKACMYIHQTMEWYEKQNKGYMCPPSCYMQFMKMCNKLMCQEEEKCEKQMRDIKNMQQIVCCTLDKMMQLRQQCMKKKSYELEKCEKLIEKMMMKKAMIQKSLQCKNWQMKNICGKNVMKGAMIVYGSMLNCEERQKMKKIWKGKLNYMGVYWMEDVEMNEWMQNKMQCDATMRENMMILQNCKQIPIFMDPQNEMKDMMMNYVKCRGQQMTVLNANTKDLMNCMRREILCDKWVFVEEMKSCQMSMMEEMMKMNWRKVVLCTNDMEMKIPSCCCKINCMMTPKRLQCMVLTCIMKIDCCSLWNQMNQLCNDMKMMKEKVMMMNKDCCEMLSCADPNNICNNMELMEMMCSFETMSNEMKMNMQRNKMIWTQWCMMMEKYRPAACHAASLYSCLCEMKKINHLYHYSCEWFMNFFCQCMKKCEMSYMTEKRVMNIIQCMNEQCYQTISCELFEKHRILFSFLMSTKMMKNNCQMNQQYWNYLVTPPSQMMDMIQNPCDWMSNYCWNNLYCEMKRLQCMYRFKGICEHFMKNNEEWKKVCDSCTPWLKNFPSPYSELNMIQKMMVIKALCPDQMMACMINCIKTVMGDKGQLYISNMKRTLHSMIPYSSNKKPILMMISKDYTGSMIQEFKQCALQMNKKDNCVFINISQMTSNPSLKKMIEEASCKGNWVYIENICLRPRLMQQVNMENVHEDFRLWVPVYHYECISNKFMNNCAKIAIEPTENFQNTLMKTWNSLNEEEIMSCKKKEQCMKVLFGCCMLHSMILERQKYKSQKWKCYCFSLKDFVNCKMIILNMVNNCEEIQWECLQHMVKEICYGAKLLDEWHNQILTQMIKQCLNKDMMNVGYCFSPCCDIYKMPEAKTMNDYIECIKKLPSQMCPEHLGLACNTEKLNNIHNKTEMLECLWMTTDMKPKNCERKKLMKTLCCIQDKITCMFNMQEVMKNYPICYEQPMNALVVSEVMMWNSLFKVMKNDICNYKNMLNQFNTMNWSNDFECLANNKVPQGWIRRSIKTIKPLPQWMMEVERKMNYMRNWVKNGQPMCIDISMLINPNTFFMCIKQCCIRKNWEIMRKVHIECKPMKMSPEKFSKMPQEGFYVCGMWMQGGCWDYNNMRMMNVEQNMIQNRMPVFHMIPVCEKEAVHEGKCCIPLYCEQEWKNQVRTYPNKAIMLEIPTEVKNNECVMKNMSMFLEQCI